MLGLVKVRALSSVLSLSLLKLTRLSSWFGANASIMRRIGRRAERLLIVFCLIAIVDFPLAGQNPSTTSVQVGQDGWGFKQGAPEDVIGLAQTTDGFLWIATPTGLVRFDGARFETFHSPFGDQLLSTNIFGVFAPPTGGLWVGYAFGGFSFLNHGRVTNYGGEIAASTGSVSNFAQDRNGIVWAATSSGLWRFDHARWQHIGKEWNVPPGVIGDMGFDRQGTLWILTGFAGAGRTRQILYLPTGTEKFRAVEGKLSSYGFTLDPDGNVVTGMSRKPPFKVSQVHSDDGPLAYPVMKNDCLAITDRSNSIWSLNKANILVRVPEKEPILDDMCHASRRSGETYHVIPTPNAKLIDREGNLWIGNGNSIDRFFYSPLIGLSVPEDNSVAWGFTVVPDEHGAVWIENGRALYRVTSGKARFWKSTPVAEEFAYRAPDKTFWFAGDDGLLHLVGARLVRVKLPAELETAKPFFQTITEDRLGGMWVSFGRHGLYRVANGVWTLYGGRNDLPRTGVVIEFTDSLGRVWFGYTKNTLAVLDSDRVTVFGPGNGLNVGNVTAISGRGTEIWIGGEFGLQQVDQGKLHTITGVNDQWLRGISGIVETANGDLWLNGLSGILHIRRSEILQALSDDTYHVKGEHFGRREGLPGLAFQVRPLNTAVEGTDSRLWFTGKDGVVSVDPNQSEKKTTAFPISIQSVSADDKFYDLASPLKFPALSSSVQISYAAVSLSDPEAVRFRYRMQETDKGWHEAAAADPVSYRNLGPGSYHFIVEASDSSGSWSDKVATLDFTILPAYYQSWWFLGLCLLSGLFLIWTMVTIRLLQKGEEIAALARERTNERIRIARDLHDTLLQSVHGLMLRIHFATEALPDNEPARQELQAALARADDVIVEGRRRVEDLREEVPDATDFTAVLAELGQELEIQKEMSFQVTEEGERRELNPAARIELYKIAREALRNTLQHSGATGAVIALSYGSLEFIMKVSDNGVGISPSILNEGQRHGHWGLIGMRERTSTMKGKIEIWSSPSEGTEIELCIPAKVVYRFPGRGARLLRLLTYYRPDVEDSAPRK
jgi:signal transduction histidine kinase/ligand-binding sensor domain-containing protein